MCSPPFVDALCLWSQARVVYGGSCLSFCRWVFLDPFSLYRFYVQISLVVNTVEEGFQGGIGERNRQ